MPKRITIEPHLSLEELETRYRQAKEPVERTHYQIISSPANYLQVKYPIKIRAKMGLPPFPTRLGRSYSSRTAWRMGNFAEISVKN